MFATGSLGFRKTSHIALGKSLNPLWALISELQNERIELNGAKSTISH